MDGYHHYARPPPPPPPAADPYRQYQYQHLPPPPPPPPRPPHSQATASWYPNQFQYHPPPPPPHQQQQQWPPYPPPHPQFPPPPPPHQYSAPYPPQEWSKPNWYHQQTGNVQARSNAEEWAARAKVWADAKAATNASESPHAHLQQAAIGENNQFHSQYQPAENSGYPVGHQQPQTGSNYQQPPRPPTPQHSQSFQLQEGATVSFRPSTHLDGHAPFSAKDGNTKGAAVTHTRVPQPTNPLVHQQEVPSSYSSISGNEGSIDNHEKSSDFPLSVRQSMHHPQPSVHASTGPASSELPFSYGDQLAEPTKDLADQTLQVAPGFPHQNNFTRPGYAYHVDSSGTTSATPWTSTFVLEGDPSSSIPLPITGHDAQSFGRLSGLNYMTTIRPPGAQFGLGVGAAEPPVSSFSIDAYGVSSFAERPKKAPVPNWLREEIIKTKAALPSMPPGHAKDQREIEDGEDEDDQSFKGDQPDVKSIDSSKLTEDEADDEDYVEAAKTAAINQEIKRVLTEVLLKVTDEIFDEIAKKVLDEDDLETDGEANLVASYQPALKSSYVVPTPNLSGKVSDVEVKKPDTENSSKSSGDSPPNILGLANYSSDNDSDRDGDELQSSTVHGLALSSVPQNSVYQERNAFVRPTKNGRLQPEDTEHFWSKKNSKSDLMAGFADSSKNNTLEETGLNSEQAVEQQLFSSGGRGRVKHSGEVPGCKSVTESGSVPKGRDLNNLNLENEDNHTNSGVRDSLGRQNTRTSGRTEGDDDNQYLSSQQIDKDPENIKVGVSEKEQSKNDGRAMQRGKKVRYDLKETKKEHLNSEERQKVYLAQERKSSGNSGSRENINDGPRSQKSNAREDDRRSTRRQKDTDRDRSAPEQKNDSERYKRRHSSPESSLVRNTKDNANRARISSDEASDDSRRKSHSRKRTLSPSPVRSRRRQVLRSPHSKRYERRHSPYSSVEANRGKRSRSKSPGRRPR
ncbi:hypothetical protein MLD38_025504 [Melastoma candidum]|uniref:Uncharacterized protein n=1 Tax=Melastoma candidum TaxID=119954 RepID=A0ACB9NVI5_9MYRT|nr:hypothetical protein MLD38_025504 [Melastoma candidum]